MDVAGEAHRKDILGKQIELLRSVWQPVTWAAFGLLIPVLLLSRLPLPGGHSFGYNSFARNLTLFAIAGGLVGARGLRLERSWIGVPLLVYLLVAALSVAVNHGEWGGVRVLIAATGVFFVTLSLTSLTDDARWLFHWLGAFVVLIVIRELSLHPWLLAMRESYRHEFVTDHPNALGYCFALASPIFLAGLANRGRRPFAAAYAAAALVGVLVTFSRAAWLGAVVGIVTLAVGMHRRRMAAGAMALVVGVTAPVAIATGYLSLGRTEADWQRVQIIEASLSLFREHWLFGIGFGISNLERLFPGRYLELFGKSLFLFHSHNFYVDLLTGTGVIGAIAGGWLIVRLVRLARACIENADGEAARLEAIGYASSIGVLLLIGLFDMPLYHAKLLFVLAVIWAMAETAARRRPQSRTRK